MPPAFAEPVAGGIPTTRRVLTRILLTVHSSSTNALLADLTPKAFVDLIPKHDSQEAPANRPARFALTRFALTFASFSPRLRN